MGRPVVPQLVKIRQAIIQLNAEEFEELMLSIEIIREIREAAAEKLKEKSDED